jgi:hypothetical protein
MATPIYKGAGQPTANSGWLSGLASWFGGGSSTGYLGGATPVYKPAPVAAVPSPTVSADDATACSNERERITVLIPCELIDPQQ